MDKLKFELNKEPIIDEQIPYVYTLVPSEEFGVSQMPSGQKYICGYELVAIQGNGYDFVYEEISNVGHVEHFHLPEGGLIVGKCYSAKAINESRDWETGCVDDYDVELYEVPSVTKHLPDNAGAARRMEQEKLMKYDPARCLPQPYPSHAKQYRAYHGDTAWLYNPWTGVKRAPEDIGSDCLGFLITPPTENTEE